MYKLTITNRYNLYQYTLYNQSYFLKDSFESVAKLKLYIKQKMNNVIQLNEVDEAVKFMSDTTHNTAEFGFNGTFTVSYYDDAVEE